MSLVGIGVGSSSVNMAAYSGDGVLLSMASNHLAGLHPEPGSWEQGAEEMATSSTGRVTLVPTPVRA
jgi:hypothetical protein